MKNLLIHKKILLGVSGGIAAYKIAEFTRMLRSAGAEVQVVMTAHAKQFITPLTLEVLSQRPVYDDLFAHDFESNIGHIQLARWPDIILIAPASANVIARIAHGIADDLLTTLILATSAPIAIAPAMNQLMWKNPATQDNLTTLQQRGISIIGPASGEQACGDIGLGRMSEPVELLDWLEKFFIKPLSNKKILITAGPTREAIDPVRYLSNRSSGKMGYAIAEAFALSGAAVTLISGPTALDCPARVNRILVNSAQDMHDAVKQNLPCDIFIGVAAVADYRPESVAATKIKKSQDELLLRLVKNPDILADVANTHPRPFIVGFAAETDHHLENAKAKLLQKNIDMMVLNAVENAQGFDSNNNQVTVITSESAPVILPLASKFSIANQLTEIIQKKLQNLG